MCDKDTVFFLTVILYLCALLLYFFGFIKLGMSCLLKKTLNLGFKCLSASLLSYLTITPNDNRKFCHIPDNYRPGRGFIKIKVIYLH